MIYMDNQATTPVDPRVVEAMLPYFGNAFGNAASRTHPLGRAAADAVESARVQVAAAIGADPSEIIFTSGATESDNLAVKGVARLNRDRGDHLVTSVVEHDAVLHSCRRLEREGFRVTYLPVDETGRVRVTDVAAAITERTLLVTIMQVNNEIGVVNPVSRIGALCRERGVWFHTDAAQGVGKVPVDVEAMRIDLLSLTAHKIYGPKGVGALYVRRRSPRVRLQAEMDGGGQERGFRSGTLNVPGIVGLGMAAQLGRDELEQETVRLTRLREQLRAGIMNHLDGVRLNGHPTERIPGNLNLSFEGIEVHTLMASLSEVALSSGSACTSGSLEPSYVLRSLGLPDELAHASIRFGIGRFNTEAEVHHVASRTVETVRRLRERRES
jgi:cysteine desulfurase